VLEVAPLLVVETPNTDGFCIDIPTVELRYVAPDNEPTLVAIPVRIEGLDRGEFVPRSLEHLMQQRVAIDLVGCHGMPIPFAARPQRSFPIREMNG